MAADSRITHHISHTEWKYKDNVRKVYFFNGLNIGLSYWGLAEFGEKQMIQVLEEFERTQISKKDDVDSIADKLKSFFEKFVPELYISMGMHLAGYKDKIPRLHHVFHEGWHGKGQFTNEDCHKEYHFPSGDKVLYRDYKEYPVLFNGDNLIANALFNYIPRIQDCMIFPKYLQLDDCVDLAKLIISTSINRLNYYFYPIMRSNKIPETIAYPIYITTITQLGLKSIEIPKETN